MNAITINLNGKSYPFRYSTNSLMGVEGILKEDVFEIMSDVDKLKRIATVRAFIWGGIYGGFDLQGKDCPLTVEEVGKQMEITVSSLPGYIELMVRGFGTDKKNENGKPEKKTVAVKN